MNEVERLRGQATFLRRRRLPLEEKLLRPSSMIAGSLSRVFLPCGKKECACKKKGHPGHGPYWAMNLVVGGGRQKRIYLKKKADIQAALAYRRYQKALAAWRAVTKEIDALFNQLRKQRTYTPGE